VLGLRSGMLALQPDAVGWTALAMAEAKAAIARAIAPLLSLRTGLRPGGGEIVCITASGPSRRYWGRVGACAQDAAGDVG
jgi:hypothetical protein